MPKHARSLAVHIALVAMLLRALLPAGWMPASGGGTTLVICTGDGLSRIHLDAQEKPVKDDAGHKGQDICPFAAAAHLAPPAPLAIPPDPATLTARNAPQGAFDQIGGAPLLDAASPRGPPLNA